MKIDYYMLACRLTYFLFKVYPGRRTESAFLWGRFLEAIHTPVYHRLIPDSLGGKNIGISNESVSLREGKCGGADKSAVGAINRPLRPVHTCEVKEYGESVQIRVFC